MGEAIVEIVEYLQSIDVIVIVSRRIEWMICLNGVLKFQASKRVYKVNFRDGTNAIWFAIGKTPKNSDRNLNVINVLTDLLFGATEMYLIVCLVIVNHNADQIEPGW